MSWKIWWLALAVYLGVGFLLDTLYSGQITFAGIYAMGVFGFLMKPFSALAKRLNRPLN